MTNDEWRARLDAWPRAITRTPAWAAGMIKVLPGIYAHNDEMHISEDEAFEALGIAPTPENSAMLEQAVQDILRELMGRTKPKGAA